MTKNLQKKLKKFYQKNAAFLIVALLALAIGLPVVAFSSFDDRVIDRIADKYLESVQEVRGFVVGAMDKSTFEHGIEITGGGFDLTDGTVAVSGITGDVSLAGVTTTIPWMDASFQVDLNFQQATNTEANNVDLQATELLVGTHENTGADLICTDVWIDIYTANGIFAYDMVVGTSTSATSSDAHLINATTNGWEVGTTTTDILSKEDDEGTSTQEAWEFNNGEFFAVTQVFVITGATSSASFTAAGGNATAGKLHANCRTRY